jgi:hypothetical protein
MFRSSGAGLTGSSRGYKHFASPKRKRVDDLDQTFLKYVNAFASVQHCRFSFARHLGRGPPSRSGR